MCRGQSQVVYLRDKILKEIVTQRNEKSALDVIGITKSAKEIYCTHCVQFTHCKIK